MSKKLIKFITKEEYYKLQEYVKKNKPCNYEQYSLAIMLGFEAGIRISEIVGYIDRVPKLSIDKINIKANTIRIEQGKGQKDRIVPLPKNFKQKHLQMLPISLSRRSLQDFIIKTGYKALNKKLNFHMLRHGFGSHLAASGRPLHEIQMLMGHSRLDTTGIYLHANPKKAIEGAREVF